MHAPAFSLHTMKVRIVVVVQCRRGVSAAWALHLHYAIAMLLLRAWEGGARNAAAATTLSSAQCLHDFPQGQGLALLALTATLFCGLVLAQDSSSPAAAAGQATADGAAWSGQAKDGVKAGDVVDAQQPGYEYVYGYEDYVDDQPAAGGTPSTSSSGAAEGAKDSSAPSSAGSSSPPKQRLTRSKRAKKATYNNKEVEFAPAAEVKFGDDIDDEGEGEGRERKRHGLSIALLGLLRGVHKPMGMCANCVASLCVLALRSTHRAIATHLSGPRTD